MATAQVTRSRRPSGGKRKYRTKEDRLRELKLSPEVEWYLRSRKIKLPTCPPKIKTPEPGELVKNARFDPTRVDRVLAAFAQMRHTQGQWAGATLTPDPWQVAYIIAPVFGWVRWDDDADEWVRVVTDLYVDVPRKNGKSTIAGGLALYLTAADREPGAQVVAAASTERQAGFVFNPVKLLVNNSASLRPYLKPLSRRINHEASGSYFEVVSSAAEAQHGANIHGAIIDELHIHKTPDLVEALETGRGSRRQPLVVIITTADEGKPNTIYARRRDRVERAAKRIIKVPHVYGVVWAADREDDPFAISTQRKANPGYGVSPTRKFLRDAAADAKTSPAELAKYQRLHLGIRTKQTTPYITLAEWTLNRGLVDETLLKDRPCYGGLDLGNVADLTALCWLFPDRRGLSHGYDGVWRFWLPEDQVDDLDHRTAGSMTRWIDEGWVSVTPGATTDYDFVIAQIKKDQAQFNIRQIGFDPWNSNQLTKQLSIEGAPLVEVRQGFGTMSPALKECKRLLASGTADAPMLRSGANPVMYWMTDNLSVATDPAGNVKPDKARAAEKIDGWSALVTAMSRAMLAKSRRSAYAEDDEETG